MHRTVELDPAIPLDAELIQAIQDVDAGRVTEIPNWLREMAP